MNPADQWRGFQVPFSGNPPSAGWGISHYQAGKGWLKTCSRVEGLPAVQQALRPHSGDCSSGRYGRPDHRRRPYPNSFRSPLSHPNNDIHAVSIPEEDFQRGVVTRRLDGAAVF